MDRDHFTRVLEDPARLGKDDIADLKAMTERFPWFSAAQLLLAVGEHRQGDVLFDQQLQAAAAHLPSRAVLYDQVQPASARPKPRLEVVRTAPTPPAPAPLAPSAAAPPAAAEAVPMRPAPTIPAEPALPPPVEQVAPPPPLAEPLPAAEALVPTAPEAIPQPALEEKPLPPAPGPDPLDRQMRQAALASSYELLLDEALPVPAAAGPEATPPPPPPAPATTTAPAAPARANGPRRFTEWLSLSEDMAPATAAPDAPPSPADAVVDPLSADDRAIIDRFIAQSTPAAPPARKAAFFNPQQAAKRSLEDHADLVTETLARIYQQQGNLAKAIAAYERLAVKHPERSAYFRGLAKALRP